MHQARGATSFRMRSCHTGSRSRRTCPTTDPVTAREMLAGIVEEDAREMREVAHRAVAEDAGIRFGRLAVDFHEVE